MANEQATLRITAEKLGTISEVKSLLTDLEYAYNSIYAFDFIVDSIAFDRERQFRNADERFHRLRKYWKEFSQRKDFPYDPSFYEMSWEDFQYRQFTGLPNLLELQSKLEFDKIILPSECLSISKVNIQSPGFWEFLGSLNPLQQIREFLKDHHERKKDKEYRSRQEEELGDLSIEEKKNNILNERIAMLRELGYSEQEIRQFVTAMVITPLNRLGGHQDNGQLKAPEE